LCSNFDINSHDLHYANFHALFVYPFFTVSLCPKTPARSYLLSIQFLLVLTRYCEDKKSFFLIQNYSFTLVPLQQSAAFKQSYINKKPAGPFYNIAVFSCVSFITSSAKLLLSFQQAFFKLC